MSETLVCMVCGATADPTDKVLKEWDWFTGYLTKRACFCPQHADSQVRHDTFALSKVKPAAPTPIVSAQLGTCKAADDPHPKDHFGPCKDWQPVAAPTVPRDPNNCDKCGTMMYFTSNGALRLHTLNGSSQCPPNALVAAPTRSEAGDLARNVVAQFSHTDSSSREWVTNPNPDKLRAAIQSAMDSAVASALEGAAKACEEVFCGEDGDQDCHAYDAKKIRALSPTLTPAQGPSDVVKMLARLVECYTGPRRFADAERWGLWVEAKELLAKQPATHSDRVQEAQVRQWSAEALENAIRTSLEMEAEAWGGHDSGPIKRVSDVLAALAAPATPNELTKHLESCKECNWSAGRNRHELCEVGFKLYEGGAAPATKTEAGKEVGNG